MPTATDLVTDLPADFEVFGQAVATSMADLLGGTTGQILSKTSNTDMDFTWTTPNPGDITGVTAGTGISGGGTSGDVTVTNSMATALTTKGDLTPATGSAAFARLGVGANNTVLTADSAAATGMKWATPTSGSMTLLSTTSLTGTSITISSINQTYRDLLVRFDGTTVATTSRPRVAPNGSTNIVGSGGAGYDNNVGAFSDGINNSYILPTTNALNLFAGDTENAFQFTITNYASTSATDKQLIGASVWNKASATPVWVNYTGLVKTTSAISSLVITTVTGVAYNAGTVKIYGVN